MTDFKRLGDIATYINGYAFKPEDRGNEGLPIIRIQDLTGNSYDLGFYNGEYPERIEINDGDVLISWSGSLGVYLWNKGKALLNQHIFKVVFDKAEIDKSYFIYAIQHHLKEMEAKTHGATMKHITKKDFDNMLVPYPNIQKQREIAGILSTVDRIIASCQLELTKLDELVKSRFVEMFGDPIQNPMAWQNGVLASICKKITDGEHGSVPRVDAGVIFLNAKHVKKDGSIDWTTVTYISNEVHNKIYARCNPEPGDILLTTTGTIGNVAIVPDIAPFSMDRGITLLKPDGGRVNNRYLASLLNFDCIQTIMNANVHASAIGHLFLNKVMQIPIIVPPLDKQEKFAAFVEQTDKSKFVVQQSLEKVETLKKSLMQQYFG